MEEWREVVGFSSYEVSNIGRVRRVKAAMGTRPSYILKPRPNKDGRIQYCLYRDGKRHEMQAHRLVLEAFIGPCPETYECRHLDGNHLNNSVENLCWGTRSENMQDKRRHGTSCHTQDGLRKFGPEEIAEIRKLRREGMSFPSLAKKFEVWPRTIEQIVKRKTYYDLP